MCGIDIGGALSRREIIFVPCVNPDGVEIALHGAETAGKYRDCVERAMSESHDLWNANARGVDLNHNFNAGWDLSKALEIEAGITAPAPRRFGGYAPQTEPEVNALVQLCMRRMPRTAVALHSQGAEIYYEYGEHTPERGERLAKEGCAINGKIYRPAVWTPQEAHDADLLIVCLKYGALPGALDSIKAVTGPHTTIMSLMNGVDSEDIIASAVGGEHLLYSLIKVASHKEADGFHFDPATTVGIIFGEKEPPCDSPRVKAVEALFGGTELHFRATDCIQEEMWSKFRLNVCNNLPQAILGAGVGCYRDSVHMKAISDGLRRELEAIAAAKGIDMQKVDAVSGKGCAVKPSARYSTLQDLDAGRHTEIDMFSGALIRMGKELGIPTPYNEFAYHMIKALEEKNDGKFDYTGPNQEMTWAR